MRARPEPLGACSACAGDYEDPDRTAWREEDEEDEEKAGGAAETLDEKFPVQGR
jgi:hypothetical protein